MTAVNWLQRNFTETLRLPPDAAEWLLDLWHVIQVFDDVADGEAVTREDLHEAIWASLVRLSGNPFFLTHVAALQPALAQAILKWKASDDVEREGVADARSYMWRAGYYDVVLLVVLLSHGHTTAMEMAPSVMALYGESFAAYREEFSDA